MQFGDCFHILGGALKHASGEIFFEVVGGGGLFSLREDLEDTVEVVVELAKVPLMPSSHRIPFQNEFKRGHQGECYRSYAHDECAVVSGARK